ncbi:hypothetical protein BD779DRAFT_236929 [Infundibulicybe gibba]|nr:hypothetical protein BD779DRAFT_236929 [Infundibulicybe gibba]
MGLFKRFWSLFKSTSLPKMSVIPTAPTDVALWQSLLNQAIALEGMKLADVEAMRVTKLELWKRPESPFHEFLLCYISSPSTEVPICILIDRTRTADKETPSSSSRPKSMIASMSRGAVHSATSQSTPRESLQVIASSSDSFHSKALDQFHQIATPQTTPQGSRVDHHPCYLLKTASFHHGHCPGLVDLISATNTLSLSEESYKLLETQCYWFSGSLFIYLARSVEVAPGIIYRDRAAIKSLTDGLKEEARGVGLKEGCFRWITIFDSETVDVSALRSPVSQYLDGLRASVTSKERNGPGVKNRPRSQGL